MDVTLPARPRTQQSKQQTKHSDEGSQVMRNKHQASLLKSNSFAPTCVRILLAITLLLVGAARCGAADEEEEKEKFPGSASLKTNRQLERWLDRADEFAEKGLYDLATILWQRVLEETGDTLVTRDGRKFSSLSEEVERTIAKLPAKGLRDYRITADGEALALLAEGKRNNTEEQALSGVVRQYFLSSHGDDAAYRLGCLALDRYDFVGASRLFQKILDRHPDPSIPKKDIWLRLAVAAAHVGDIESAQAAIAEAEKVSEEPGDQIISLVKQDLSKASKRAVAGGVAARNWTMAMGGPGRQGHMQGLPKDVTSADLTKMWSYTFDVNFTTQISNQAIGIYTRRGQVQPQVKVAKSSKGLLKRWSDGKWQPAGRMLFADGLIYVKTNNDITCWDASAESEDPVWRSAWLNEFKVDQFTLMMNQMVSNGFVVRQGNQLKLPMSHAEVMLFGDRIHQSMSISRGVVYAVEGRRVSRYGVRTTKPQPVQQQHWHWGVMPNRSRTNWLAAYDAKTGKALWHKSPSEEGETDDTDLGFMAAPVPYGNFLLVPVADSGAIWLQARDRKDGKLVWKSFLADDPPGGTRPWSPIGISLAGRDAYVVCGSGAVFAVDAVSGEIRWAVKYKRDGKPSPTSRNFGVAASQLLALQGWEDDLAIPFGRQLVVFSTDHDRLYALDRRTGEMLWRSPRTPYDKPATYPVGIVGTTLFVAGRNVVRAYDLDKDGKIAWELETEDSLGRACATDDALYMPIGDSIARIDLESGKILDKVAVHLSAGEDPIGNLYSDGQKLWMLGGNSVFALTNKAQRLSVLEQRIRGGSAQAYIERMQIYAKDGEFEKAEADLVAAFKMVEKTDPEQAYSMLFDAMNSISLAAKRPGAALAILGDHCINDQADSPIKVGTDDLRKQLNGLIVSSMRTIRKSESKGHASAVLKAARTLEREHQQVMARQALLSTVEEKDGPLLRAALAGSDIKLRTIAAEPAAAVLSEDVKPAIQKMLASKDDSVRHAAARALASLSDADSLSAFANLLESEDARIRLHSSQALRSLTGQKFKFNAYGQAADRTVAVKEWRDWIAAHASESELKLPLPDTDPLLGRTLIAYYNHGRVIELDSEGNERWRKGGLDGVWSVQGLPNGHRVVGFYQNNKVIEFDADGKEVWRKDNVPANPFSARRLLNGNTLVTCSGGQRVIEYRPDGEVAWQATVSNQPMDARRLENGNTLVACSGDHKVVEVDKDGKVVWQVTGMQGAIAAQRLENGNTLIAQSQGGKVVEVDAEGTTVWEKSGLSTPYDAQRVPSGNTIILDSSGVREIDPSGKIVWERKESGASRVSRF